jgi:hypothetical protein
MTFTAANIVSSHRADAGSHVSRVVVAREILCAGDDAGSLLCTVVGVAAFCVAPYAISLNAVNPIGSL